MTGHTRCGNWIPQRVVLWFLAASVLLFAMAVLLDHPLGSGILYAASAVGAVGFLYLEFAAYLLHRNHGALQRAFHRLVIDKLDWDGRGEALDIGTGNGVLAVELAKESPPAKVTGIDLWGKPWSYSRETCLANAALAGVADRVCFSGAGADRIPFPDGHFDAVVSNFVFHTVRMSDRLSVLQEALRVLKKGGRFSFQDLFNSEFYDDPGRMAEELASWGVQDVRFMKSSDAIRIPPPLRINHIAGNSGVLFGTK
jgi:SAM-dependent methyltransferase